MSINGLINLVNDIYYQYPFVSAFLIFIWGYWSKHIVDRKTLKKTKEIEQHLEELSKNILNRQKQSLK